jgi:hypothetical protein
MVGQAPVIGWLHPPDAGHSSKNNTLVVLTERYWS